MYTTFLPHSLKQTHDHQCWRRQLSAKADDCLSSPGWITHSFLELISTTILTIIIQYRQPSNTLMYYLIRNTPYDDDTHKRHSFEWNKIPNNIIDTPYDDQTHHDELQSCIDIHSLRNIQTFSENTWRRITSHCISETLSGGASAHADTRLWIKHGVWMEFWYFFLRQEIDLWFWNIGNTSKHMEMEFATKPFDFCDGWKNCLVPSKFAQACCAQYAMR